MPFGRVAHLFVDQAQMRIQYIVGRRCDRMAQGVGNSRQNGGGMELHEQRFGENVAIEEGVYTKADALDAVRCLLQERGGVVLRGVDAGIKGDMRFEWRCRIRAGECVDDLPKAGTVCRSG